MTGLARFRAGECALDVGCGTGNFASALADHSLAIAGLDPDPEALRFAAARDPNLALVRGRAQALPFAEGSFDHVIAITSLCSVRVLDEAAREM